jgi:hypothetical protein
MPVKRVPLIGWPGSWRHHNRAPKRGRYRPVNHAGFRSVFAGPLGAKPRPGKRRR